MKRTILTMAACITLIVGGGAVISPQPADAAIKCRVVNGKIVCGPVGVPIPTITPKAS